MMTNDSTWFDYLEIRDGNILLPLDKYIFELSEDAARNLVSALTGALARIKKEQEQE